MPLYRPGTVGRAYQDASRMGARALAAGAAAAGVAAPYAWHYWNSLYGRAVEHSPAVADYQMERMGALPTYHTNTTYDAAKRVQSLQAPASVSGSVSRGSADRVMYAAPRVRFRRTRKRGTRSRTTGSGVYTGPRRSLGIKGMITGGLLGLQLKFVDWQGGVAVDDQPVGSITTRGTALPLQMDPIQGHMTPVSLGDGPSSRTSNRLAVKSLLIQAQFTTYFDATGTPATNITAPSEVEYLMYLVLDTQTSGSLFDAGDVWLTGNASGGILASLRNMVNVSRYRVLKTWKYRAPVSAMAQVNPGGLFMQIGTSTVGVEEFFPIDGIIQKYDPANNTGDIAGVVDNSLHLCLAYRFPTGTFETGDTLYSMNATVQCRVRYYDQ